MTKIMSVSWEGEAENSILSYSILSQGKFKKKWNIGHLIIFFYDSESLNLSPSHRVRLVLDITKGL